MTIENTTIQGKSEAAIQQINLGYNTQQDRLLLRVGLADNSELMVWLTYRITKQLWQILNGESHLPSATSIQAETLPQQAVEQFKQEIEATEALKKMDFTTEYQARKEVVNDGVLLAVSILIINYSNKLSSLELPCLEGITVRMNLTHELTLALCNMLQLSAKEATWDLGIAAKLPVPTMVLAGEEVKKVLH